MQPRILLAMICILAASCAGPSKPVDLSFRDPSLPVPQRVEILLRQLTLEEKVSQMLDHSPAIERLQIRSYTWWNEGLHGVARTAFSATVFPQAIGLAATWDTAMLRAIGDVIASEARAVYNLSHDNTTDDRYRGLTFWSPNINIFRDPRWGRGQETFGEDPHLTAWLGYSFVKGLQGEDTSRPKVTACAKHYAVHSGPEASRHVDNYVASPKDLWETYLPAFRTLVQDAQVIGVMCAYNRMNGQPCCANDLLLNDILRNQWKFRGYLTSDCFALYDFFSFHKTHKNAEAAAVDALVHSVDLECGKNVYTELVDAVEDKRIPESRIDDALRRLLTIRFNLGTFDPPGSGKYDALGKETLEAPAHDQLALQAARNSIVLLKNDGVLPLSKSIRRIAVIGPNADNRVSILGNYNGIPSSSTTVFDGIREKVGDSAEIIFEPVHQFTENRYFKPLGPELFTFNGKQGFHVEYLEPSAKGKMIADGGRIDQVNIHRPKGESPSAGVPADQYIARYSALLSPQGSGRLVLEVSAHHGYRLKVDGKTVMDRWDGDLRGKKEYVELDVNAGRSYELVLECQQRNGHFTASLKAGNWETSNMDALLKRIEGADVVIYAGGISPELEGEEMSVELPGFKGGDRTSIMLPAVQAQLLEKLRTTGKPLVFVMMTGSAIAIPKEDQTINAIVNAWYGGQHAGRAVADVLFGDHNPSGRLPISFYSSDKDLPAFTNYSMANRTYRYFRGELLYPFGFGLSYTSFRYSGLTVGRRGDSLAIKVNLANTGNMDGVEVAQCYISYPHEAGAPLRSLKGFSRVEMKKGSNREIRFTLGPRELQMIAADGKSYIPGSSIRVAVGGQMPGSARSSTSNWLEMEIMPVNQPEAH